jgi:hypothetical protein
MASSRSLRLSLCVANEHVLATVTAVTDDVLPRKPCSEWEPESIALTRSVVTTVFRTNAYCTLKQRCDVARWALPTRIVPLTYLAMRLVATHLECPERIADYQYYDVDLSLLFELLHVIMHNAVLLPIMGVVKGMEACVVLMNPQDESPVPYMLRVEMGVDCAERPDLQKTFRTSKLLKKMGVLFAAEWQGGCIVTSTSDHVDKETTQNLVIFCEKAIFAAMHACSSRTEWDAHQIRDSNFEVFCPQCESMARVRHACAKCRCVSYCSEACRERHKEAHAPMCRMSRLTVMSTVTV